jgi:ubiquinone biosynthesis protein COQ9
MAIDVSLLVSLLNLFGFGGIVGALIFSWWKSNQEFIRIKNCILLELKGNLEIAKQIVSSMDAHTFPAPLLREEAWHILMSSEQIKKFGGQRVEDPILELGYIYRKISLINQTILSRSSLVFGAIRASRQYDEILNGVDASIKYHTEEIVRLYERDESCFLQKDIVKAFRDMALGKNEEANRIIKRQATQ